MGFNIAAKLLNQKLTYGKTKAPPFQAIAPG
jgi:hypothetical protein